MNLANMTIKSEPFGLFSGVGKQFQQNDFGFVPFTKGAKGFTSLNEILTEPFF